MNDTLINDTLTVAHTGAKYNETYILVFKTNIRYKKDIKQVAGILNKQENILSWNIDRADVDNILRIESLKNDTMQILTTVTTAGFFCEELQ